MKRRRWWQGLTALVCVLTGVLLGLGSYTFWYAEGASYFSSNPRACVNCHVMREHFDSWQRASHHAAATCTDCHLPHATLPKYVAKAENGFWHSLRFTLQDYDVNALATRQEMRSFVCGQCHVEYYFKGPGKVLTYPWHKGLKVEQIEGYYDAAGFADWVHAETGAKLLKAQHPEFEVWNQGVHARSGVACADCHMPYKREGAVKISDHHVRSPLLNVNRACQTCHHFPEDELKARVGAIQGRTRALLGRAEDALVQMMDTVVAARQAGADAGKLDAARALHRKAQWRIDFVLSENSLGFHAPQEVARILGEAIDYARQGQIVLLGPGPR
jgi:cytochrome c nitrite reductase small subunit